jgi:hypothetical protein
MPPLRSPQTSRSSQRLAPPRPVRRLACLC